MTASALLVLGTLLVLLPVAARAASDSLHVAPSGNDAGAGTADHALATLDGARSAIRKMRSTSGLPAGGVTVWIHGGDYVLDHPFELTSDDSGTAGTPIIYRAAEGDAPVRLLGARRLAAGSFRPIADAATLNRIAPALRGKVVELDLAALGTKHTKAYPDVFSDSGGLVDLYVGGKRMPLARYPNEGFMTMKRVIDAGGGVQDKNWADPAHARSNRPGPGTFEYRDADAAHFAAWQAALDRGVWLKGYWRVMWQNEAVRIGAINPGEHTVTLAKPVQGGIGNKYHRPAGSGQEQFWLLNLLEEVDRPGEWCVDFKDRKLYFYPPAPLDARSEILLADSDEPIVRLAGASHIVLRGLTVEANLGAGILIKGGEDDLIAGCTVRNVDKYAVVLDGGARNAVQSCDLYDLGAGGVWLGGGDEKSTPRVAAGHRVVNNHIHDFSQIERIYAPGVNAGFTGGGGGGHHVAVGMLVAHNLIHDTPHGGVLFGSFDSVFEYNEIFRYCTVSNDLGAFYAYDTYERMANQTFRYNLMHDTGDGDGIYFDHDHRDMHVYGNVALFKSTGKRGTAFLYKGGSQAKNPTTIECYNNVAMQCNTGFQFVSAGAGARAGKIENNVTVACKTPWIWRTMKEGKEAAAMQPYATGKNVSYEGDPGFVDPAHFDFRLKPGAQVLKDLPGFAPIPMDKVGLYVDEYRRRLPSADEIDRFGLRTARTGPGYDVEDRK